MAPLWQRSGRRASGASYIWAVGYLIIDGPRRLLGSFNHGSMANALPQAIGAQVSHPGRQVVSLSGDGGLAMLMGDVLLLRQLNRQELSMPPTIIAEQARGI